MKKISCFFMVMFLVFGLGITCHAESYGETEGQLDSSALTMPIETAIVGIWQVAGQPYFISVNVNGIYAIGVTYVPGGGAGYVVGTLSGNTCDIYGASGLSELDATLTLTSDTTGKLKVNKCIPEEGYSCPLPTGISVNVEKVF